MKNFLLVLSIVSFVAAPYGSSTAAGLGAPLQIAYNVGLNYGNDGHDLADPHLTTVNGSHYDFQSAGEFVDLRDSQGMEVQTRKTAITTDVPGTGPHAGALCASINTAVAARVGSHRVTYEPSAVAGAGMQLRIDGVPSTLGAQGVTFASGGHVGNTPLGTGIDVDFTDGSSMTVTANDWPQQSTTYLNVSVFHTPATEGILGHVVPGGWIPALPNSSLMGPQPTAAHQLYVDLYQTFANAWRVTNATSLFDYAPGTSTATFTFPVWPSEKGPCFAPKSNPGRHLAHDAAQKMCNEVADKNRNANCVFDVAATGAQAFVKGYLLTQRLEAGATRVVVGDEKGTTITGAPATFTATVRRQSSSGGGAPVGSVQFTIDGSRAGDAVKLDGDGRAMFQTSRLPAGKHQVSARYIAAEGSVFLPSSSLDAVHTVIKGGPRTQ